MAVVDYLKPQGQYQGAETHYPGVAEIESPATVGCFASDRTRLDKPADCLDVGHLPYLAVV